jgi:putative transposase
MAKPYSQDLRKRVKQAVDEGHAQSTVAKMFKIGTATVERYMARWRQTGSLAPAKFGGHMKHKLAEHADKVKALIKAEPDQTLAELQIKLEEAKIKVSVAAIDRFLKASKITYKKNAVRHRTETRRCR